MGMSSSKSIYMACTLLPNQVCKARTGTITLDRDCLCSVKSRDGSRYFSKGEFYPIKLGFQRTTFGFQRGEGGSSNIGFQRGTPLSKCVTYLHLLFVQTNTFAIDGHDTNINKNTEQVIL
jgi:hypothetical protein